MSFQCNRIKKSLLAFTLACSLLTPTFTVTMPQAVTAKSVKVTKTGAKITAKKMSPLTSDSVKEFIGDLRTVTDSLSMF